MDIFTLHGKGKKVFKNLTKIVCYVRPELLSVDILGSGKTLELALIKK